MGEALERRVLLCDDATLQRTLFARFAKPEGWTVAGEAADAEGALSALRSLRVDLVVVDGRLPPSGALAVLPGLLAERPDVPILIVVAFEESSLLREALALGAAGALLRPLLPSQVAEQLRRVARTLPVRRE